MPRGAKNLFMNTIIRPDNGSVNTTLPLATPADDFGLPFAASYAALPHPAEAWVIPAPEQTYLLNLIEAHIPLDSAQKDQMALHGLTAWHYLTPHFGKLSYADKIAIGHALRQGCECLVPRDVRFNSWNKAWRTEVQMDYPGKAALETYWEQIGHWSHVNAWYLVDLAKQHGWEGFEGDDRVRPVDRETADRTRELISYGEATIDADGLLPELAPLIKAKAATMNAPLQPFIGALLPTAASCINPKTRLVLANGQAIPPILWLYLVADSSVAKSPIINAVARSPLSAIQRRIADNHRGLDVAYQAAMKLYKRAKDTDTEEPTEPTPMRQLWTADATMEAVLPIVCQQPDRGLLIMVDELAGFFRGFDQYRGGKGSKSTDRPRYMSLYDGGMVITNRVKAGVTIANDPSVSIVGGIQPQVLTDMMRQDTDDDGFWPRFLAVRVNAFRIPLPSAVQPIDIDDTMQAMYTALEAQAPQTHYLSAEAIQRWDEWHAQCEDDFERSTGAERMLYRKLREQAGRIALITHRINAAMRSDVPTVEISISTVEAAIGVARYCMAQALLIQAGLAEDTETEAEVRYQRAHDRLKGKVVGWDTFKSDTRAAGDRKLGTKETCCKFMLRLVELRLAEWEERDVTIRVGKC
jgi:Protein of unknown function (DUF3987)